MMAVAVGAPPADAVAETSSATGNVVRRNSERSLTKPRSAMTATGLEELKVNEPENEALPLKGVSFRKAAICPFAAIVVDPEDTSFPSSPVNVNETTAASLFGFDIARPLRTTELVSP